jgi:hypothetical protein
MLRRTRPLGPMASFLNRAFVQERFTTAMPSSKNQGDILAKSPSNWNELSVQGIRE